MISTISLTIGQSECGNCWFQRLRISARQTVNKFRGNVYTMQTYCSEQITGSGAQSNEGFESFIKQTIIVREEKISIKYNRPTRTLHLDSETAEMQYVVSREHPVANLKAIIRHESFTGPIILLLAPVNHKIIIVTHPKRHLGAQSQAVPVQAPLGQLIMHHNKNLTL